MKQSSSLCRTQSLEHSYSEREYRRKSQDPLFASDWKQLTTECHLKFRSTRQTILLSIHSRGANERMLEAYMNLDVAKHSFEGSSLAWLVMMFKCTVADGWVLKNFFSTPPTPMQPSFVRIFVAILKMQECRSLPYCWGVRLQSIF